MEQFDHGKSLTGIGFEIYNVSTKFWQAYDEALGTNKTPTTEEPKTAIKTASNSIERKYQNGQVPRTGLID